MPMLRDHPDIENALLTGYPRGGEPKPYYCEVCEDEIENEDEVFEDELHECMCKHCLLEQHKKRW
jgi:hypothetical protein